MFHKNIIIIYVNFIFRKLSQVPGSRFQVPGSRFQTQIFRKICVQVPIKRSDPDLFFFEPADPNLDPCQDDINPKH